MYAKAGLVDISLSAMPPYDAQVKDAPTINGYTLTALQYQAQVAQGYRLKTVSGVEEAIV